MKSMMLSSRGSRARTARPPFVLFILMVCASIGGTAQADLADVENAQKQAQSAFNEHFLEFTKDKNVMGKAKTPDGKEVLAGKKRRFDKDGGGYLPFQSDLTYHDFSYRAKDPNQKNEEEENNKNGNDKNKNQEKAPTLEAFVSHHGGISAAGGSSLLERTVYELHRQLSKQDEEEPPEEEEGTVLRSVQKIEIRDIQKNEGENGEEEEPDKVERVTLRDEVVQKVEEVGETSFQTIQRAGRDKGFEDDQSTLANGVLLRYAAGTATQAWWNATMANLAQRRVNRGVKPGKLPLSPRLSEGVPDCDQWGQAIQDAIQDAPEEQREQLQEEVQKKLAQCKQVAGLDFRTVNPRFQRNEDGQEQLETGDLQKEGAFQRDLRNQLEILSSAGKDVGSLQTNWQYDRPEDKANRVTTEFDEQGQPLGEQPRSVQEQLDSYNQQLQAAAEGMEEVRSRFPDMPDLGNPLDYQIAPESRSVMDINGQPVISAFEEANIPEIQGPITPANNYEQLIGQGQ